MSGRRVRVVEVRVPGDKSITHRALLLAALAHGTSRVRRALAGEDTEATAGVLRSLGCAMPELGAAEVLEIDGLGLGGLRAPAATLDCANSGTTARLLLGVLGGHPFRAKLTGDTSLRSRPMRRVTGPLSQMGAVFRELGEPDRLPIEVEGGRLRPLDFASPRSSAQVKSALLLAGLVGGAPVRVSEPVLSRDHTERLLRAMGANLVAERTPAGAPAVRLEPPEFLEPLDLTVPGDFSSAAFFLALGLLAPAGAVRIRSVGVNPTRVGLLEAVQRMGATIELVGPCEVCGEPVADVVVRPSALRGTDIGGAEIPALLDEVPLLAVLAARATGETRITGAAELRVKESDRLAALAANLRALGVEAEELADGLVIRGTDRPLRGRVRTFGDHRVAMAFGVLAMLPGNRIDIVEPQVVRVSYPGYWRDLERCAAELSAV